MRWFIFNPNHGLLTSVPVGLFLKQNPTIFPNLTEPLEQTKNNHWKQKHGHRTQSLVPLRTANSYNATLPL